VYVVNGGGAEVVDVFSGSGGEPVVGTPLLSDEFAFGNEPAGVAVDNSVDPGDVSKGNVYVTDVLHNVVEKMRLNETSGEYEEAAQLTGFGEPVGVCVDALGDVYVANYGSGAVEEFDPAGGFLGSFTTPLIAHPQGVAVDSAGDIFIQAYSVHTLAELKRSSELSTEVASEAEILPEGVTAIAYERSSDALLVDLGSELVEYDAAGVKRESFGAGVLNGSLGVSVNEVTGDVYASDASSGQAFRFALVDIAPPAVDSSPVTVSHVGKRDVTLAGVVNPGHLDTTYHFEYGESSNYGQSTRNVDVGEGAVDVETGSVLLVGLRPSTLYHYRLVATNSEGTTEGPDGTITTAMPVPPIAIPEAASAVTTSSARLSGNLNTGGLQGTYRLELADSTGVYLPVAFGSVGASSEQQTVSFVLTNLSAATVYGFRITVNTADGTAIGSEVPFTTGAEASGPVSLFQSYPLLVGELPTPPLKEPTHKHKKKAKKKVKTGKKKVTSRKAVRRRVGTGRHTSINGEVGK